jgi:hypothetical protein
MNIKNAAAYLSGSCKYWKYETPSYTFTLYGSAICALPG